MKPKLMAIRLLIAVALLLAPGAQVAAQDPPRTIALKPGMSRPLRAAVQLYNGGEADLRDAKPVGGKETKAGDNPWQVALVYLDPVYNLPFCGGSIVAPGWVLTAAHCVDKLAITDLMVVAGLHDLDAAGGERIRVARIYVRADFKEVARKQKIVSFNDLALLQLAKPTTLPPISLAEVGADMDAADARVTGWGATAPRTSTDTKGPMLRVLQGVDLRLVPDADCNDPVSYDGLINATMLCAGHKMLQRDACNGDSGGPLTGLVGGRRTLLGVVSWGDGCAQPEKFGVYARVNAFRPWIDDCIAGRPCARRNP